MIYLLHGTDTIKSRKKLHTLLDSIFAKKPDASYVRVEAGGFDENQLQEFVGGQGLFENKYIIVFDIPEDYRRFRDLFRQCLINRNCRLLQKSVFVCPNKDVFIWSQKVVANCHLGGQVKFIEANKVY